MGTEHRRRCTDNAEEGNPQKTVQNEFTCGFKKLPVISCSHVIVICHGCNLE
jgi:hypothetical protein